MTRKSTHKPNPSHEKRRQPLAASSPWDDVDDAAIVALVRAYIHSGDAILFGSSQDQEVAAIRVYRAGSPYSVYFRKAADFETALDRLERYRPPMRRLQTVGSWSPPLEQDKPNRTKGTSNLDQVYNDPEVVAARDTPDSARVFARRRKEILGH